MKVNLKNPCVMYLGREPDGRHLVRFDMRMNIVGTENSVLRSIKISIDEKQMWNVADNGEIPHKHVRIKEPDDIEVVEFIND